MAHKVNHGGMTPAESKDPGLLETFLNDLPKFTGWIKKRFTQLFNWLFSTTEQGGTRRRRLMIFLFAFYWARSAAMAHPFEVAGPFLNDALVYPFTALFAADIMRHVVVIIMIFRWCLYLAAKYLSDVFEIEEVRITERYLLQSIFGSVYDTITIRDGEVAPEHLNSPVYRVGGPGQVRVHFDNAVVFEKADGSPRVIGPHDGKVHQVPAGGGLREPVRSVVLDRFERLREVVDLRDQVVDINGRARTQDGIHVTAQGGQMVYSVVRDKEPSLKQPHPFEREAIERIVYSQSVFKVFRTKQDRSTPPSSRRGNVPDLRLFVQSQLNSFISQRMLSEFLTAAREPERALRTEEQERLRQESQQGAVDDLNVGDTQPADVIAVADNQHNGTSGEGNEPVFISRDELTRQFYEDVNQRARERGMHIHWIDVGTWVLPEEARDIQKQNLEAWKQSMENVFQSSERILGRIRFQSRNATLMRLFREVPLNLYFTERELKESNPDEFVNKMLYAFRDKARDVWNSYHEPEAERPEELYIITRFLNLITSRRI